MSDNTPLVERSKFSYKKGFFVQHLLSHSTWLTRPIFFVPQSIEFKTFKMAPKSLVLFALLGFALCAQAVPIPDEGEFKFVLLKFIVV